MKIALANARGSMILQMLVAAVISGVVLAAWMSQMQMIAQMNENQSLQSNLRILQNDIRSTIDDDNAWDNTVADAGNSNLSCLKSKADCTNVTGSFSLLNAKKNIVIKNDPTAGFNKDTAACSDFGSADCQVKVDVSWVPLCIATPCKNPRVQINVKFNYIGKAVLAVDKYNFSYIRKSAYTDVSQNMSSLGTCPAGQVMVGYQPSGALDCRPPEVAAPPAVAPPATPGPTGPVTPATGCSAAAAGAPKGFVPQCACNCDLVAGKVPKGCSMKLVKMACTQNADSSYAYVCQCPAGTHRATVQVCPTGCVSYGTN